ncbi:MAG: MGMT family protein [Kiritimatiellia bacterium]
MDLLIESIPTTFQKKVYKACSRIPSGKVSTYGDLAAAIDCGSARAVGQALKVNPYAPEVPCHRVIRRDRRLGGFFGQSDGPEVRRKEKLLREEGVQFDGEGRVDPACLFSF